MILSSGDIVAVYEPGKLWHQAPPEAAYSRGTVVVVIDEARAAIRAQVRVTDHAEVNQRQDQKRR